MIALQYLLLAKDPPPQKMTRGDTEAIILATENMISAKI